MTARIVAGTLLVIVAGGIAAAAPIEGVVVDAAGAPMSEVAITVEAVGASKALPSPTGSDGRFAFDPATLFTAAQRDTTALNLTFSRPGFRDVVRVLQTDTRGSFRKTDYRIAMSRELTSTSVDAELRGRLRAARSIDGRTLYLSGYDSDDASFAKRLNDQLPRQIKRGILTHMQSLPLDVAAAEVGVATMPVEVTTADTERVRAFGAELNALAVIGGTASPDPTASTTWEISSEFVIIPSVEGFRAQSVFVDDRIPAAEIGTSRMHERLSALWGQSAVLAVALREFNEAKQKGAAGRADLQRIRTYLRAERATARGGAASAVRQIDSLIAKIDAEVGR